MRAAEYCSISVLDAGSQQTLHSGHAPRKDRNTLPGIVLSRWRLHILTWFVFPNLSICQDQFPVLAAFLFSDDVAPSKSNVSIKSLAFGLPPILSCRLTWSTKASCAGTERPFGIGSPRVWGSKVDWRHGCILGITQGNFGRLGGLRGLPGASGARARSGCGTRGYAGRPIAALGPLRVRGAARASAFRGPAPLRQGEAGDSDT